MIKQQKILIKRTDGGVSIMSLVLENPSDGLVQTADAATIEREIDKAGIDALAWELITEDAIPVDRTFRSAWKHDLTVDMDKAKEIHKDKLRGLRIPKLLELDIEYQKADEQNDSDLKKRISQRKQELRDITKHSSITSASTPEELKVAALEVIG